MPSGDLPAPEGLLEADGRISQDVAARGGRGSPLGAGIPARPQAEDTAVAMGTVAGQVDAQLTIIGATSYEVHLTWPEGRRAERRGPWVAARVLAYVDELAVAAEAGATIGIRPVGHAVILVEKLDRAGVETLRTAGWEPAILLQTAPASYAAWLRLARNQLPEAQLVEVASALSRRFSYLNASY